MNNELERAILNFVGMDMVSTYGGYDCVTVEIRDFDGNRHICTRTNLRQAVIALAKHYYGDDNWVQRINEHALRQEYENLDEPEGVNEWQGPEYQTVDKAVLQDTRDEKYALAVREADKYMNLWRDELHKNIQWEDAPFFTHIREAWRILFNKHR